MWMSIRPSAATDATWVAIAVPEPAREVRHGLTTPDRVHQDGRRTLRHPPPARTRTDAGGSTLWPAHASPTAGAAVPLVAVEIGTNVMRRAALGVFGSRPSRSCLLNRPSPKRFSRAGLSPSHACSSTRMARPTAPRSLTRLDETHQRDRITDALSLGLSRSQHSAQAEMLDMQEAAGSSPVSPTNCPF